MIVLPAEVEAAMKRVSALLPSEYTLTAEAQIATVIRLTHVPSGIQCQLTSSAGNRKDLAKSLAQAAEIVVKTLVANGIEHQKVPFLAGGPGID